MKRLAIVGAGVGRRAADADAGAPQMMADRLEGVEAERDRLREALGQVRRQVESDAYRAHITATIDAALRSQRGPVHAEMIADSSAAAKESARC